MKVSQINIGQKDNIHTFKGLWGEQYKETHVFDEQFHTKEYRTIKPYYPFLDETKGEIEHVVGANQSFAGGHSVTDDLYSYIVEIKETLNFTKREWNKYLSGKLSGALDIKKRLTAELIENNLRKLNLTKHIKL